MKRVEAPDWLYIASRFNPLTYLVEAERALFMGEVFTLWCAGGAGRGRG
jgi:hypothetical protein